jgi:putative membrane protein
MRSPKEYHEEFEKRSAAFEKAYPTLVRGGMLALVLLPLGIFLLMLVLDAQLPTIACFVVALVVIYSALILIEYFHDRIQHKRDLTELPEEELEGILRDTLREEFLAYAPVDAIIERRKARKDKATVDKATADDAAEDDAAEGNASEDDAPKGGDE